MTSEIDQEEHSIEMQLPFLAHLMQGKPFSCIPILVGTLSTESQHMYGRILSEYFQDPCNFFIISSDFCHWGARFRFQLYDSTAGVGISHFIEQLDQNAMDLISKKDYTGFQQYLQETGNTICGRYPILVLLQMLVHQNNLDIRFTNYKQSAACQDANDSSVSYAAAVCFSPPAEQ